MASVLVFVALLLILFFFIKRRKVERSSQNKTHTDENPVYGDYYYSDPKAEAVDTNDYYSSDYEAGTGTSQTADNNDYYE